MEAGHTYNAPRLNGFEERALLDRFVDAFTAGTWTRSSR